MNVKENNAVRYTEAKDNAGLRQMVGKAIASYGKARVAVQVAIVAILCHAAKHNDYSQANALIAGLGTTKTARDVALFFRDFGGLSTEKVENEKGELREPNGFNAWQGPKYIAEHLESAKAQMFWAYKQTKGNVFAEYSLEEMARQFINRHEKAAKAAAKGEAKLDDTLSEITRKAVWQLVKFESIVPVEVHEGKAASKAA